MTHGLFSDSWTHRTRWILGFSAPLALVLLLGWADPARAVTETFTCTGSEKTFVVPAGVSKVHVAAIGGSGGEGDSSGGVGAEVTSDLSVVPGQTFYILVGCNGADGSAGGDGGFNGGGDSGGSNAGGGGGASDMRSKPSEAASSLDSRLIVAAGAGGGGGEGVQQGGAGGDAGQPGESAEGGEPEGGGAGTELSGGAGGFGPHEPGDMGEYGLGGDGGATGEGGAGGGGGGGFYGGGGGGGGISFAGGGGGGGSSLVPAGGTLELADPGAEPSIELTYDLPVSLAPPVSVAAKTALGKHPKKLIKTKKKKVKVKFTFSSDVPGATFQCKLDKGKFVPCTSPKTYKVKLGKHNFSVKATGPGGTDTSPAKFSFKVAKKR